MNKYKLFKAGINVTDGIRRFNNNTELYQKFLYQFPDDQHFDLLCKAIQNKDSKAAFDAAHSIKGLAGNLSLVQLYQAIDPLVEELRKGNMGDAEKLIESVKKNYNLILRVLREDQGKENME